MQPTLQRKSNKFYIFRECVCSLRYPAYNAHVPYILVWSARLYNIFPHYLINGMIFEKGKLLKMKCFFLFTLQLLSETLLILRRTERDMIKIYIGLYINYPLFLSYFHETWIFSTVIRKILTYEISWKSVRWEPSSMRTDGQTSQS